jgi:REP element-mobilizing transposase RayT
VLWTVPLAAPRERSKTVSDTAYWTGVPVNWPLCQMCNFFPQALAVAEAPPYGGRVGRPPRLYAHGIYHVAGHGSDDRILFRDDIDRRAFLEHLEHTFIPLGLRIVSFVLMTNHHHLIVATPDSRIARGLHDLHGGYARIHNRRHERTAHLWRAHPLARRIEDNDDLITTDRYLAHNPVEAGIVPGPFDWVWSSATAHAGLSPALLTLDEAPLRGAYENAARWRDHYYHYVAGARASRAA